MAPYTRQHHHHLAARKGSLLYSGILFRYPLIWTTCFVVLSVLFYMSNDFTQNTYYNLDVSYLKGSVAVLSSTLSTSFDATLNSQLLGEWRSQTEGACRNMMETNENKDTPVSRQQKEQLERNAMSKFKFPTTTSGNLPDGHKPYEYCRNVFIDLGTNIGDSIGYFIDNALDVCSPIWMQTHTRTQLNADFPRPHLDVTTLEVIHKGAKNNPLYGMLQKELTKTAPAVTPDTFCIYGMEGNPEFTERLQKLENHVMQMQPRPVQHLHIHTESVVTAVDGPTKLFLDKTSVEQNVSFFVPCCIFAVAVHSS